MNKDTAWRSRLDDMKKIRSDKLEGWDIELVQKFPKIYSLQYPAFIGSFAWSMIEPKMKIMKSSHAVDYGAGYSTPADIARDYIHAKFGGERLRCNSIQYNDFVKNRIHQPMYCEPVTGMDAYYVDLKSAYWQILMCGGWDVDYSRNRFLSVRSNVFDFPFPTMKLARNTLVSIGLPSKSTMYHPVEGFKQIKGGGATVNLVLYGFVQDFLHAFAHEMIEGAGAVYVNTDGYIIPKFELKNAFEIAERWNVRLDVRYDGFATVRRVGDYDIAKYRSPRPSKTSHPRKYIHEPDIKWFHRRWSMFSDRIDLDYNPIVDEL